MNLLAIEDIPDWACLLLRVEKSNWRNNGPLSGAFRLSREDAAMSVDWCRYSSAKRLQRNGRKPASEYYILAGKVGTIRSIPNLVVKHSPQNETDEIRENRAHASVMTEPRNAPKSVWSEARLVLSEAFRKILDPEAVDSEPLPDNDESSTDCTESLCQLSVA